MGLLKEKIGICSKWQDLLCLPSIYQKPTGDAILSVVYLINRMPLKTLNYQSPLEALKGENKHIVPPKNV